MKSICIDPDQIATVLKLPEEDPRRRHLEECPRCASRLRIYNRFLSDEVAPGADPDAADVFLKNTMEKAIYGRPEPGTGGIRSRLGWLFAPRPAWAAAAAVLIVAVVALWWQPWSTDRTVLRSGDDAVPDGLPVHLVAPEMVDEQTVRLAWHPVEGAGDYIIRFRNPDLDEIARFGPFPDTSFVLGPSVLPPDTESPVLWRVIALKNGDEIGRSGPASLKLP